MTSDATRLRYARAIRAMSTADKGAQLLEAYERESLETAELRALMALPDWRMSTLLAWITAPAAPPGWDATDILCSRQMALIGALAKAAEQAAHLGDAKTAKAMARLAHRATLQLKGEAALAVALGTGADDEGQS